MTITSPSEDEVQGEVGFLPYASMPQSRSTNPVNRYEESGGYIPHWEEYQGLYDRRRVTVRSAVFGGLAGGIFFFGLAVAILSGHFWPMFLVALAIGSLVGSFSTSKAQAIYRGFQGCVFFLAPIFRHGLFVCVPDVFTCMRRPEESGTLHTVDSPEMARQATFASAHGQLSPSALRSLGIPPGHPQVRSFLLFHHSACCRGSCVSALF